jgi:NAD(P)-dependent dehydrogenase (short-subunit alcohol dehydrogenase family)
MQELKIPDLEDKVFLVTRASSGIGAALAIAFARQRRDGRIMDGRKEISRHLADFAGAQLAA